MENYASPTMLFIADRSISSTMAHQFLITHCDNVLAIFYEFKDPYPVELDNWHGDWILSFKSDLPLRKPVLEHANKGSINFHPAPPRYRGVGGYAWALLNKDPKYGVTCHYMVERLDYGPIIDARDFTILPRDNVASLKDKAGAYSLTQFHDVVSCILLRQPLPESDQRWSERLYTYCDLQTLQSEQLST